ncbi:YidB family protein [Gemmatimonas sp.]|uniref:YidB family protein n=1 Tax=Gemmatimonas sp. TaxID=1962908 RepID=UPI00286E4BB2|nr:YidB family protein [Gemmatimonas sp.]
MGLFDGALGDMAGSLLGGKAGGIEQMLGGLLGNTAAPGGTSSTALLRMAMTLVQQNGGVGGLVQKLQSGGLGEIVSSWVSTGANRSVTPAQLEQALGGTAVTQAAATAGVDPSQALGGLAAMLPQLVDKLTPDGAVTPGSSAMLTQVMGMLQGK